jgi:hypothetical protein
MTTTRAHALLALVFLLLFFSGCTTVDVVSEYGGSPLPRPERVLVYDLAVTPEEVQLDHGLSALAIEAMKSSSRTQQEIEAGHEVAAVVSKYLVEELQKMGLPSERAERPVSEELEVLLITGQFLSIDEGNRTERVVIGLGAGRSDVKAEVQLRENGQVMEELDSDAKSARTPGMAETMGVGALAGHLLTSAIVSTAAQGAQETFGANVEADGRRTAKDIAKKLEPFFVRQGWIEGD